MALSQKRKTDFENLITSPDDCYDWLVTSTEAYFLDGKESSAFKPFELFIGRTETLAEDLKLGITSLSRNVQRIFIRVLEKALSEIEGSPDQLDMFLFLVELAWALPAPNAIKAIEKRLNPAFVDYLFSNDSNRSFDEFCEIILALARPSAQAVSCIKRIVDLNQFNQNITWHVLVRLIEIDPDNWVSHFALTRSFLFNSFKGIAHDKQAIEWSLDEYQDNLAKSILSLLPFDLFANGLGQLLIIDNQSLASDKWFLDSLILRLKLVEIAYDESGSEDEIFIAQADRLADPRQISIPEYSFSHPQDGAHSKQERAELYLGPKTAIFTQEDEEAA